MAAALTEATILGILNALKAATKPLNAATLVLFKAPIGPNRDKVAADITPADFPGYADAAALVFGNAYRDAEGKYKISAPSILFETNALPDGQSIYGYAIMNAAKDTLYYAKQFDTPVMLLRNNQGFSVEPTVTYGE